MEYSGELRELLGEFGGIMIVFLPVLFGTVEFIKSKLGMSGKKVELLSVGLFVLFGVLIVVSYYFPTRGIQVSAIVLFLLMCALAPSGIYKFINTRARTGTNDK